MSGASLSERVALTEVRDLLVVGAPLPFRVLDSAGRLLLNAGNVLKDDDQFESLVARGAWAERVLVEAERLTRRDAGAKVPTPAATSLFDRWEGMVWKYDKLSRSLVRSQVRGDALVAFGAALQALVDEDADVALFLCFRQADRRFALYPLHHALQCAVLGLLAGRHLKWPAGQVESLVCAALSMNLAIFELQADMAEQGDPPSTRQFKEIRAHPAAAAQLLESLGVADPVWLEALRDHHEIQGGGGYPRGVIEVAPTPRLLRIIDVLMAKVSPRAKRPSMAAQQAVRQIFQQMPGDALAMAVIKVIGVHPPGSLVQLRSGEVGIATRRPAAGVHPIVATLSDPQGRPVAQTHRRDSANPEFAVIGAPADTRQFARVVPERVYGLIG